MKDNDTQGNSSGSLTGYTLYDSPPKGFRITEEQIASFKQRGILHSVDDPCPSKEPVLSPLCHICSRHLTYVYHGIGQPCPKSQPTTLEDKPWTGNGQTMNPHFRKIMEEQWKSKYPDSEPQSKESQNVLRTLPTSAEDRKQLPITTGVLDYFPLALAEIAKVSKAGNDQHNPGQPLHWAREKSTDHANCIIRHLIQRGEKDTDGQSHSAKLAWRALALLQEELEAKAGFKP